MCTAFDLAVWLHFLIVSPCSMTMYALNESVLVPRTHPVFYMKYTNLTFKELT